MMKEANKILDTQAKINLKPGAIITNDVGQFWIRMGNVYSYKNTFTDLHDGKLIRAKDIFGAKLIQDGPNHVIDTMLEGWEEE